MDNGRLFWDKNLCIKLDIVKKLYDFCHFFCVSFCPRSCPNALNPYITKGNTLFGQIWSKKLKIST